MGKKRKAGDAPEGPAPPPTSQMQQAATPNPPSRSDTMQNTSAEAEVAGMEYQNLVSLEGAASGRRKKPPSSRIGRACDRCQHRKLACDSNAEGCTNCQRAHSWCTVTDPLTRTPTYRGEVEYLERRVNEQFREIRGLLSELRVLGSDTSRYERPDDPETEKYRAWTEVIASGDAKPWEREERAPTGLPVQGTSQDDARAASADPNLRPSAQPYLRLPVEIPTDSASGNLSLPDVRTGLAARRYMGVDHGVGAASRSDPGFRLNMLGWELDIASFAGGTEGEFGPLPDFETPLYDKSFRSFVATAYGHQPRMPRPQCPSREEAFQFATIFLHGHNAFMPILRGDMLTRLLKRVYDEPNFRPTEAADACLHIMFAITIHNLSLRMYDKNQLPPDMPRKAEEHYHYAIGFLPQLLVENSLEAMQALVMISNHVREFPLPELGYYMATLTFNRLVKLNYHRSISSGQAWAKDKSLLEIEMRKRVFWSSIMILVPAAGRLGRPMPIRPEDIDVELPVALDDTHIDAMGESKPQEGHCSFRVAIEGMKVIPIYMELYSFLYAARKAPEEYPTFVRRAETRITRWAQEWHPEFQNPQTDNHVAVANSTILRYYLQEFRLLLYHPSLSLTKSAAFNEANLRRCLAAIGEMLQVVLIMKRLRVMDGTWNNCAAYLLAMQTLIYGHSQLRTELTPERMEKLRADLDAWLDILGEIGDLVGSGPLLQNTMRLQVNAGLAQLERLLGSPSPRPKSERASSADPALDVRSHRGSRHSSLGYTGPPAPTPQAAAGGFAVPYKAASPSVGPASATSAFGGMSPVPDLAGYGGFQQPHPSMDPFGYPPLTHSPSAGGSQPTSPYDTVPAVAGFAAAATAGAGMKLGGGGPTTISPTSVPGGYHHASPSPGPQHHTSAAPPAHSPSAAAAAMGSPLDAATAALYASGGAGTGGFAAADSTSWQLYTQALQQQASGAAMLQALSQRPAAAGGSSSGGGGVPTGGGPGDAAGDGGAGPYSASHPGQAPDRDAGWVTAMYAQRHRQQ